MIRLFVGIGLPGEVSERLAGLSAGIPGARWVAPENLHVTLRFIGEVDEAHAQDIHDALSAIHAPRFDIELAGIGLFGSRRQSHTLWVGVQPSPALTHLQGKVESAVARAGLPAETRKFSPHVTIARLKQPAPGRVEEFMARNNLFRSGPVSVQRFTLFSSHLGRTGADYTAEAEYDLE